MKYTNRLKKQAIVILFFLIFSVFNLSSLQAAEKTAVKEPVYVANVNGTKITRREFNSEINKILPGATYHGNMPQNRKDEIQKTAIDNLVLYELKYQHAKKLGQKVDKKIINEELKKIRDRFKSKKEFENALNASSVTVAYLENLIEKDILVKKLDENKKNEIDQITATDDTLLEYYNKNREKFIIPEQRRLRHILLKVEPWAGTKGWTEKYQKAEEVFKEIKEGKDFSELAKNFSDDASNVNGGELGFVHQGQLSPSEIDDNAYKLKIGEVSPIIQSLYGYHILKLEEIKESRQMEFAELHKERLKKDLEMKMREDKKEEWIKGLKEGTNIQIFWDIINQVPEQKENEQ